MQGRLLWVPGEGLSLASEVAMKQQVQLSVCLLSLESNLRTVKNIPSGSLTQPFLFSSCCVSFQYVSSVSYRPAVT